MAYERFLIAPIESGCQKDLSPWMISDDAFERLNNACIFRGKVKKRFGSYYMGYGTTAGFGQLHSRLRIALSGGAAVGITDGSGNATGTVPGAKFGVGQMFSIGNIMYTVSILGTPATMLKTDGTTTATYNTTTGVYVFAAAPINTQIYFYSAQPVMGITQYEKYGIYNSPTIAFDTQYVYQYTGGSWEWSGPANPFAGSDSDFFWATTWNGTTPDLNSLFVTNFHVTNPNGTVTTADDSIAAFDGTTWSNFTPKFKVAGAGNKIITSRIIVHFIDRLWLINTIETDSLGTTNKAYNNRFRYSHNGQPFAASAFYVKNEVGYTGGGFFDASTKEAITNVAFEGSRLIISFETSKFELAPTGNAEQPAILRRINNEVGTQSTFSSVAFDKAVLDVGPSGIHACNGVNVNRIDEKIPDQVFDIRISSNGIKRIHGARDFSNEMVYWSYPSNEASTWSDTFPDKVLVYNSNNGAWSINDDSITSFGYFEEVTSELNNTKPIHRQLIAGNHQGYIFVIDNATTTNASVLQISNVSTPLSTVLTIKDHNLQEGDFLKIENCLGTTTLNDNIYQVVLVDSDSVNLGVTNFTGTYTGGGTASRVSRIDILTKRFNPYNKLDQNVHIGKVNCAVKKTDTGAITVDAYPSGSSVSLRTGGISSGAISGDWTLDTFPYTAYYPLEAFQELLWHPVDLNVSGQTIQLRFYFNNTQMVNIDIVEEEFELEGMLLYMQKRAGRF